MLRRLHLILAALAMLIAPLAMQSGVAMAAMPMDHGEMAEGGHCGESAPEKGDKPGAMTQCCIAMCAAVAPLDAALVEPIAYHAPVLASLVAPQHRPFLAELPTPPPRLG
jgi:hypothetical protein